MIKMILNIGLWVVCSIGIVVLLGFVDFAQEQVVCSDIKIEIDRSNGNFFVEEEDINAMVYHEIDTVLGRPIAAIRTERLEHKISNHPSVSKAEVYKTINGKLIIEVKQRTPIVRIFNQLGESFYIDSTGSIMPPSENYTSRVLIANGFINDSFIDVYRENARNVSDTVEGRSYIDEIFTFAEFIRKNNFWNAQIEQLYVNKDFEIELIPRVGNHRIVFGDALSIHEKFDKLKVFYFKGLNKTGWNEYSIINLKYADQVVCTKR
jgi:cell division protein FtsQ